ILEDAGSRLHALGTSGASPAQVDALLGKLDAGIASLRAALTAAAAGDAVAFRAAFRSAVSTDEDANLVDDALGTTQCGQILTQPFRQRGAGASPPG
ncbi:MAG TPA: hypothetical protein VFO60_02990, partial [Candidatus Dormibacteraeota bacterium]|nr:hypothetical protein [Candidatus Dormibacteraeota bacterium]